MHGAMQLVEYFDSGFAQAPSKMDALSVLRVLATHQPTQPTCQAKWCKLLNVTRGGWLAGRW